MVASSSQLGERLLKLLIYKSITNDLGKIIAFLCFFFISAQSRAQEPPLYRIQGFVADQETGQSIPLVNIIMEGRSRGTVTNELGEFEIKVDSLPVVLLFSHVAYQRVSKLVSAENEFLNIGLPTAILDSVLVQAKDESKLYSIIDKARVRTEQLARNQTFGRAFYRQLSRNDSIYTELYEIFYDVEFNSNGIIDWALQEGRYALVDNTSSEQYIFNRNFTLIDRVFPTIQLETDLFITPIQDHTIDYYELKTERIIKDGEDQIAVISFIPITTEEIHPPAMEGEVYINLRTFDIIKLSGKFHSKDLKVVTFDFDAGSVKDYTLSYEVAFKYNENEAFIEYIKSGQSIQVEYPDRPMRRVETSALLTFFDYYQPGKKDKRLGGRLRFDRSDQALIDRVDYDAEFWRDNPIVKRTPAQDEVIASFEKNRQFGSIFLNNKNQVSLIPELDSDPLVQYVQQGLKLRFPPQEKIFLHLDKPWYAKREIIWFKAYLVDGASHQPLAKSGFITVDLIDPAGDLVATKRVKILAEGVGAGNLEIGTDFYTGTYQIRAYTDRMSQLDPDFFFTQEIKIYSDRQLDSTVLMSNDFEVAFFPEGGELVYGLPIQLAFKAIDASGQGIEITGTLKDALGNSISPLKTGPHGMGSLFFTPLPGAVYQAEVSYQDKRKQFDISAPLKEGYAMSVINRKDKNIMVRVLASPEMEEKQVYLFGQTRGRVYYKGKGRIRRRILTFEIPRNLLPDGILQLTLMDTTARPLRERLVFVDQRDKLAVAFKLNRKKYDPKEEVELDIQLTDDFGQFASAEMSLSVTDGGQITIPANWINISNYLLLSSDLKGSIDGPDQFFQDNSQGERALDLVMLTNGWRRFRWEEILDSGYQVVVPRFMDGFEICGSLKEEDKRVHGSSNLSLLVKETGYLYTTRAEDGRFCFSNVIFEDTSRVMIQSVSAAGPSVNLAADLDPPKTPGIDYVAPEKIFPIAAARRHIELNDLRIQDELLPGEEFELLREVVVKGNRPAADSDRLAADSKESNPYYSKADAVIDLANSPVPYTDLFSAMRGKVPGLQITGSGSSTRIRISGRSGDPLVIVDGVPINNADAVTGTNTTGAGVTGDPLVQVTTSVESTTNIYTFLQNMHPSNVDRIEVLRYSGAAMFGMRGGNGVLVIYSKTGGAITPKSLESQVYQGFNVSREFYTPKYNSLKEIGVQVDRRSTLHWEPFVVADEKGRATIKFYNSDEATSFNLVLQGVSKSGQMASETVRFDFSE